MRVLRCFASFSRAALHASVTRRTTSYGLGPQLVSIRSGGMKAADADPRPSHGSFGGGTVPWEHHPSPRAPRALLPDCGSVVLGIVDRVVLYRDLPKLNAVQGRDGRRSSRRSARESSTARSSLVHVATSAEESVDSRSRGRECCGAVDPQTCGKSEAALFTQWVFVPGPWPGHQMGYL